ncbi:T9SS type B sorting domain-containing protein [Snuella lapsa]|uniref:T9SS type B sorting domain-containing protein n=1 Tax=Snuella lapsa TaxID=870481 RepID=A0ABP6Y1G9_9FLAO
MKTPFLVILFSFFGLSVFSQNEAANWYFGYNAGINFNQAANTVTKLTDGQLTTNEGCASISDGLGNLLFYTDGSNVWNKNHSLMQNGSGLYGDASSTQSAIIVPKPKDPNIYYIFTVDSRNQRNVNLGLNYSIVDITSDGGLGAVTAKNRPLLEKCSEKLTAVLKDCVSKSVWVMTFASQDGTENVYDTFHAFEVSESGVNATSVKSTFQTLIGDARGYLKLSPDGSKVACANVRDGLFIYDFDPTSGKLSNDISLTINSGNGSSFPYGIEFSPNSQLLYVSSSNDFFSQSAADNNPINHQSTLTQFDLIATDIQNSQITLEERQLYRGGLQLGPDGKIYRALSITYEQGSSYLGVINSPNELGTNCNYIHNAINLSPFESSQGLPPFITSFFNIEIDIIQNGQSSVSLLLCEEDSYTLKAEDITGATYIWQQDGSTLSANTYQLEVTKSGHYEVLIDRNNGDCPIEGEAYVSFNKNPEAFNTTLLQCDEDGLKDGISIFNLNEANEELTGGNANLFTVFYLDASMTTIVTNSTTFNNTSNPQTLYVEVINNDTGCSNTCELTLSVSVTDSNDVELPAVCDDDGTEDGLHAFNLSEADDLIVAGLPDGLNISYFETYHDALTEQNNLGTNYTNTTPYSQTIYARVENANNCYGISEVQLTVNKLPEIVTESIAYYCLNKYPETININAGVVNGSINDYNYSWSTGESTHQISVNMPGLYTVEVINSNNCSETRTITVEASNTASFQSIEVVDISPNNTITVTVSGEGIYEYALLDDNGLIYKPFQENPTFENVFPGIYTISVKDVKNDCGTVQEPVSVIGFPKYFTPNNDGFNDTWQIYGVSDMFQPNTKILIYNRYGKLLKQLNPLGKGWDGTFNGEKLPSDDYWFVITLQDGRIVKNHFSLKL